LDIILDAPGNGHPDGGSKTDVPDLPAEGQELDPQRRVKEAIDEEGVKGQRDGEAYGPLLIEGRSFLLSG
jgi:hypothetical protein